MGDGRGPLPRQIAPLSWLLARAYGVGVAVRNARFDRGAGVRRLEVGGARIPVISVGNMTAGGTGKSPFVAWICGELARAGMQPVIAMRGYRADAAGRSDEAREYATTAPCARVVVGARRREALAAEFARHAAEEWTGRAVVVLDDGFQHRKLARDLDIVLVDASRPGLDGDLLPNGWLREPAGSLARADLVVLTKAHDASARERAAQLVRLARGRPHDAVCEHEWRALTVHASGVARAEPVAWLAGRGVVSACALGNPAHFHGMAERAGVRIAARLEKADHVACTARELDEVAARAGADCVVTSLKDFVKLDQQPKVPVAVPELGLRFVSGGAELAAAISAAASRACGS